MTQEPEPTPERWFPGPPPPQPLPPPPSLVPAALPPPPDPGVEAEVFPLSPRLLWIWGSVLAAFLHWGGTFMVILSGIGCADSGAACSDVNGWGILLLPVSPFVGPVLGGLVWLAVWLLRGRPWSVRWHRTLAWSAVWGMLAVAFVSRLMAGPYAFLH